MPEYGVWLEEPLRAGGPPTFAGEGPAPAEAKPDRLVWRGIAADETEALRLAAAEWDSRFGRADPGRRAYVIEIEPGDSGYGAFQ